MKKVFSLFLFFVFSVNNAFGSPLVFSATKEINSYDLTELALLDTAKYRQIRITVRISEKPLDATGEVQYRKLISDRATLRSDLSVLKIRSKENPDIETKQAELDKLNREIGKIEKMKQMDAEHDINLIAVENGVEIPLQTFSGGRTGSSIVVDTPPTKLKILAAGQGKYSVYIWGQ